MATVDELIKRNEMERNDSIARLAGFLVLCSGEAYLQQITPTSHIFIVNEDGKWNVWRETWQQGDAKSDSMKQIACQVPLDVAVSKAKHYMLAFRELPTHIRK